MIDRESHTTPPPLAERNHPLWDRFDRLVTEIDEQIREIVPQQYRAILTTSGVDFPSPHDSEKEREYKLQLFELLYIKNLQMERKLNFLLNKSFRTFARCAKVLPLTEQERVQIQRQKLYLHEVKQPFFTARTMLESLRHRLRGLSNAKLSEDQYYKVMKNVQRAYLMGNEVEYDLRSEYITGKIPLTPFRVDTMKNSFNRQVSDAIDQMKVLGIVVEPYIDDSLLKSGEILQTQRILLNNTLLNRIKNNVFTNLANPTHVIQPVEN